MKTIVTKTLGKLWNRLFGFVIGAITLLSGICTAGVVLVSVDTTWRRRTFEFIEDLCGEEDDDYSYSRKTKED